MSASSNIMLPAPAAGSGRVKALAAKSLPPPAPEVEVEEVAAAAAVEMSADALLKGVQPGSRATSVTAVAASAVLASPPQLAPSQAQAARTGPSSGWAGIISSDRLEECTTCDGSISVAGPAVVPEAVFASSAKVAPTTMEPAGLVTRKDSLAAFKVAAGVSQRQELHVTGRSISTPATRTST
jgi:hypothetical protein